MSGQLRIQRQAERRAAEALLNGTLVEAAGRLGVAVEGQAAARNGVASARKCGTELVSAAHERAARLEEAAVATVADADAAYADQWRAARSAGWTSAQLRAMGYTTPPRTTPTRPLPSDGVQAAHTTSDLQASPPTPTEDGVDPSSSLIEPPAGPGPVNA